MSERPRMSRQQLNEARRTIARLVRRKAAVTRRTKAKPTESAEAEGAATERPKGYRQVVHLGLGSKDLDRLDQIVERMRGDEYLDAMQLDLGREKAARYAIAFCAKHMPERITATG